MVQVRLSEMGADFAFCQPAPLAAATATAAKMIGRFIPVSLVTPPEGRSLQVRDGGSVFDAAWSKWTGWHAIIPGGRELDLPRAPEEWWLTDRMAAEFNITVPELSPETAQAPPQHRPAQSFLDFSGQDSGKLSRRVGEAL